MCVYERACAFVRACVYVRGALMSVRTCACTYLSVEFVTLDVL